MDLILLWLQYGTISAQKMESVSFFWRMLRIWRGEDTADRAIKKTLCSFWLNHAASLARYSVRKGFNASLLS